MGAEETPKRKFEILSILFSSTKNSQNV